MARRDYNRCATILAVKHLKQALGFLCFVPILVLPAIFLWKFSERPWEDRLLERMTAPVISIYQILIFTAVPFGLYFGTRDLCRKIASPIGRGLLGGMVVMLWCDTTLISLPHLGIYPSYPSMLIAQALSKDDTFGKVYWIWVLVLNAVIWTGMGIAVALFRARKRPPAR